MPIFGNAGFILRLHAGAQVLHQLPQFHAVPSDSVDVAVRSRDERDSSALAQPVDQQVFPLLPDR